MKIFQLPQTAESPVHQEQIEGWSFRCAYARSADTRAENETGQDYLIFRADANAAVFVVCDGVSQSFVGDLAARFLGNALSGWLLDSLPGGMDVGVMGGAISTYLQALIPPARAEVQAYRLPADVPPLVREVLEQKRAYGSEAVFVGGRIDRPGGRFPEGRVVLIWMGDSRLRLFGPTVDQSVDLGGVFKTEQRWSTERGVVNGEPQVFVSTLLDHGTEKFSRLLAYTDGFSSLDAYPQPVSNRGVQNLMVEAGKSATSDDIAFLELWLKPMPDLEGAYLPAPKNVHWEEKAGILRGAWRPVSEATDYQVEIQNTAGKQSFVVTGTSFELGNLAVGHYQVRVGARREGELGDWSASQSVVVGENAGAGSAGFNFGGRSGIFLWSSLLVIGLAGCLLGSGVVWGVLSAAREAEIPLTVTLRPSATEVELVPTVVSTLVPELVSTFSSLTPSETPFDLPDPAISITETVSPMATPTLEGDLNSAVSPIVTP